MSVNAEGARSHERAHEPPRGEEPAQVVTAASRIEHVTVYARGALVRRAVELPSELPKGTFELRVRGITAGASMGSFRAIARGTREVRAVRAQVALPESAARSGELDEAIEMLEARIKANRERRNTLEHRVGALEKWSPVLRLGRRVERVDPAARANDAVAAGALVTTLHERTQRTMIELDREHEALVREREALVLRQSQSTELELQGARLATLDAVVTVSEGDGALESLAIEYTCDAARWWPAYTVRVAGARARWSLEAHVAQRTGEAWPHTALALSTADLTSDARLPELASLRLGRAQPPSKRAYRPAPAGLEALFESYDRVAGASAPSATGMVTTGTAREAPKPAPPPPPAPPVVPSAMYADGDEIEIEEEGGGAKGDAMITAMAPLMGAMPPGAPPIQAVAASASMPRQDLARLAPQAAFGARAPAKKAAMEQTRAGGLPPGVSYADLVSQAMADRSASVEPPQAIVPADRWNDFDALVLRDPSDRAQRGRLQYEPSPVEIATQSRTRRTLIDGLSAPAFASDPLTSRGNFDYRYDATGVVEVPDDGRPHHVTVADAEGEVTPRFRTVPREAREVYREAEARNPFDAPLLAGPVELYVEGTRTSTFALAAVDRGATVFLSLGVEERIRVARNARVSESTAGLLGGSTVVDHAVSIELSSALGHAVTVDVIDRAPVSDDRDVEVQVTQSKPRPEVYTQSDRASPVRGGARWRVELSAGGRAAIEFTYRVTLPSKSELVGGNRRE